MKKVLPLMAVILLTGTLFAQQLQVNPKIQMQQKQTINATRATVATLTYCVDVPTTSIGMNSDAEFGVYVSFPATMMGTYTGNFINQVQIGLTQIANIASVEVRIYEDTNGVSAGTATPLVSEVVNVANLVDGWNNIFLTTPYTITGNQVFVGYWMHQTAGFPCNATDNTLVDPDGGWIVEPAPTGWATLNSYGLVYNWQVKAIVDDGAAADDVSATAIVVPQPQCGLTASEQVTVTVQNLGSSALTNAFDLEYTVNGAGATTVAVPVPLAVGASVDVNFNVDMSASGPYQIDAYTILAGDADNSNDTIQGITMHTDPAVVPYSVQFDPVAGDFIGWFAEDVNNDVNTWGVYDVSSVGGGHGDNYAVLYQYSSANAADDYMFSNCIDLLASKTYSLDFWYRTMGYPEKMKVMIGSTPASGSMTTQIVDLGTITDTVWTQSSSTFTVPADGTYNLGFYAYSDADQYFLFFDDVVVDEVVNISEVSAQSISVYPTLTTGIVHFSVAANVEVYSQLGQLVQSSKNVQTINLSSMNSGVYFVKVSTDNGSVMKKVVLTK